MKLLRRSDRRGGEQPADEQDPAGARADRREEWVLGHLIIVARDRS